MAKACLNKLPGNILQNCVISPVGIKEIYLMYPEDVTINWATDNTIVAGITFASGAKSYKVEGYKQNIQVTSSLRALDASAKLDVSVSFKMVHTERSTWRYMLTGRFYVLVVYVDSAASPSMLGLTSPLEVTASDFDSNAGAGLVTFTLGAPEGSAGNYFTTTASKAADEIISKSV